MIFQDISSSNGTHCSTQAGRMLVCTCFSTFTVKLGAITPRITIPEIWKRLWQVCVHPIALRCRAGMASRHPRGSTPQSPKKVGNGGDQHWVTLGSMIVRNDSYRAQYPEVGTVRTYGEGSIPHTFHFHCCMHCMRVCCGDQQEQSASRDKCRPYIPIIPLPND